MMDWNLTTAIVTFIVALITMLIAWRTFLSQIRAEHIQERMEAREVFLQRQQSYTAMHRLTQLIIYVCNRCSRIVNQEDPMTKYAEIVDYAQDWVMHVEMIPECEFKRECIRIFNYLNPPSSEMIDLVSLHGALVSFRQVKDKLTELTTECTANIEDRYKLEHKSKRKQAPTQR